MAIRRTGAERGVDIAAAGRSAVPGHDSNGDEATGEADVKDDGKESEEADTTEEASEEDSQD